MSFDSRNWPLDGASADDARLVRGVTDVQSLVSRRAPLPEIYAAALTGARELLGVDVGSLRLVDPQDPTWSQAVATVGVAGTERWRERSPISEGLSGRVISSGQPHAVNDWTHSDIPTRSHLARPETRALMGAPLREDERTVGCLLVGSTDPSRRWSDEDQRLLVEYADRISVALAVARAAHAVRQATTDPLTGLGNRTHLLDRLDHELVRAHRSGEFVTVLFLDLDRFKLVNDSLGHQVGDQLLVAAARRLRGCVREGDVCARLGGDEFAILLAESTDPVSVAGRIIDALQRVFVIAGREVFVSVSVGIASGCDDPETMLRNADMAMYRAKRSGAGSFRHYEPSMHAALVSRLGLDGELRRALERNELRLVYEPIVELATDRLGAFEALMRWEHPTRGPLTARDFIPVAEESGLIVELGHWLLHEACEQYATWWRETPISLGVNVSMRELQRPDYAGIVEQAIAGRFPASALVLEVTETSRLEDSPGVLATLHALKEVGVRVALDDFGTGYSSLFNLSYLPIDVIKVPPVFLNPGDAARDPSGMLGGIIGLGRHLGLRTVAEGIERPEQRELLQRLGCDLGQGRLLGGPTDAATASALLDAERARQTG